MKNVCGKIGQGFWECIRQGLIERDGQKLYEEEKWGIVRAAMAMAEAGVEEEMISKLLQKYWDIKPSDAYGYIEEGKQLTESYNL